MDDNASKEEIKRSLNGLTLNHVGCFPSTLMGRSETIEKTLDHFRLEDTWNTNKNILDRTTHLYRVSENDFEPLRESLIKNRDFVHVEIVHKSSCLGLPYQVYAKHKNGYELYFDGLSYLAFKTLTEKDFALGELPSLAGYPPRADSVLFSFEKSLKEIMSNLPEHSYTMYSFYAANVKDWKTLGINNSGDAQLRVLVNDENIITITALVYSEVGKLYPLYLGDTNTVREMNSHDLFFSSEYRRFSDHVDHVRASISEAMEAISISMRDVTGSFFYFFKKHASWIGAKRGINSVHERRKRLYRYDLFITALDEVIESRWASRNAPKQIWLENEEMDDQWLNSHWHLNFFQGYLKNEKIVDLEEHPIKPGYTSAAEELKRKIVLLKEEADKAVGDGRDLLSAIQAEFSMYAVWLAMIAVIVSVATGVAAIVSA
ncbi:hypothetical protein SAMN05660691_03549 [Rheinheimera pacifica]|uniref:Uncharacterized protein n=1 Tax=Rheinheimera pacifica TaxID=173990 RepID=A0A1H6N3D0_9GAMM|nr:hypothetical protein SAMN05660691_03549 [Rheinheimera pacifica]